MYGNNPAYRQLDCNCRIALITPRRVGSLRPLNLPLSDNRSRQSGVHCGRQSERGMGSCTWYSFFAPTTAGNKALLLVEALRTVCVYAVVDIPSLKTH